MAVTPALIRELRELTGSGMSDCKKALEETNGDIKKSIEFLREKGLAAAAKKAGRIAAEGIVQTIVSDDNKKAIVIEVNSETDFVAINPVFREYVMQVAAQALSSASTTVEAFLEEKWALDASQTVAEVLSGKIATIGEKISIRRFEKFDKTTDGIISTYIHGGGKIGVIIDIETTSKDPLIAEMGKNLGMQIAALFPRYVKSDDIPGDFIESEKAILTQAAKNDEANAKKPENVIEKMIAGRLNKQLKEICLLDQQYVKDNDLTVRAYVESVAKQVGAPVTIAKFVCFEKGEGIEKKSENFADEVSKAMQG